MYIFPFEFAILVDDVIKWINVHTWTKSDKYITNHFIDFDSPLKRSKTVRIDGIYDVEVQKIEFLFVLVEWRFDECRIWEWKMTAECSVKLDVKVKCLPHYKRSS